MRIFLGLGASSLLAAGCLLVTSLDGLEGPPLPVTQEAGGAAGTGVDAGSPPDSAYVDAVEESVAPRGPVIFVDRRPTIDGAPKPYPKGITLTANDVYWVEGQPGPIAILHAPKDGSLSPARADLLSDGLKDPFDVGLDDVFLYWSDFTGNVVRRRPLDGVNLASDYFAGARSAAYLAVGPNGTIYVTDYHPAFGTVVLGPGNPTSLAVSVDTAPVAGIALCMNTIYWSWGQPSYIAAKSPPDNTTVEPQRMFVRASSSGAITGLACSGSDLYWIEDSLSIHWINTQTRTANDPLYTSDTDMGVGDIAVDDAFIYFTQPSLHMISKLAKPGVRDR
jgi:hypothetical protein